MVADDAATDVQSWGRMSAWHGPNQPEVGVERHDRLGVGDLMQSASKQRSTPRSLSIVSLKRWARTCSPSSIMTRSNSSWLAPPPFELAIFGQAVETDRQRPQLAFGVVGSR